MFLHSLQLVKKSFLKFIISRALGKRPYKSAILRECFVGDGVLDVPKLVFQKNKMNAFSFIIAYLSDLDKAQIYNFSIDISLHLCYNEITT